MVSHVGEHYFSDIFGEFSVPFFLKNTDSSLEFFKGP